MYINNYQRKSYFLLSQTATITNLKCADIEIILNARKRVMKVVWNAFKKREISKISKLIFIKPTNQTTFYLVCTTLYIPSETAIMSEWKLLVVEYRWRCMSLFATKSCPREGYEWNWKLALERLPCAVRVAPWSSRYPDSLYHSWHTTNRQTPRVNGPKSVLIIQ